MSQPPVQPKRKMPPTDFDGEDFKRALALLVDESDRGCVLVLGAWLDDLLAALLWNRLADDKEVRERLLFKPMAPLGTFSARTDAAFALGLTTADEHQALHKFREIRNSAAHFDKKLGFEFTLKGDSIEQKVSGLAILGDSIKKAVANQERPARLLLAFVCSVLIGRLAARIKTAKSIEAMYEETDWASFWSTFIEQNKESSAVEKPAAGS